jgi:hypothetical protein
MYGCVSSESWRVQWEVSPTGVKVRSPVAWIARRKETESLKPIDQIILGMTASHWAVTKVNAEVASKVSGPRGRACNRRGEGSMGRRKLTEAVTLLWRGGSDSTMARTR